MPTPFKSEKERMLAGEPYQSRDPELLSRYHEVRRLLKAFAETASTDLDRKQELLSLLFGRVGQGVWVEAPFFYDYGENTFIGNGVFINYNCVLLDSNRIDIGDHVLIGPAVQIYTATHPIAAHERILPGNGAGEAAGYLTQARPVKIGDRAWIGGGAILQPGVEVGENTTIGAGSVVTKSIPANCFAAGNPCRVIRGINGA